MEWGMIIQNAADGGSMDDDAENAGAARAGKIARVFRIARFLRLMRLAKLRQLLFTLQSLIDSEWLTVVFTVTKNLIMILALNHLVACMWYGVGQSAGTKGWIAVHDLEHAPFHMLYVSSIHWSLAQFTPGPSPIHAQAFSEKVFSALVLALGLVTSVCFVSSTTSTLSSVWLMNRHNNTQQFLLKKYLTQNQVPRTLGARVTRYIDCVLELRHKKVHHTKVQYLSLLSGPLKTELQVALFEPHIKDHAMFPRLSMVMKELSLHALKDVNFAKRDVIFLRNTQATCMRFVSTGTLVYLYKRVSSTWRRNPNLRAIYGSMSGRKQSGFSQPVYGEDGSGRAATPTLTVSVPSATDAFPRSSPELAFGPPRHSMSSFTRTEMRLVAKLSAKNYACENCLWMAWKHVGQMRAVSYADTIELDAAKFVEIVCENREAYMNARARAKVFADMIDTLATFDASAVTDVNSDIMNVLAPYKNTVSAGKEAADHPLFGTEVEQAEDAEMELFRFSGSSSESSDSCSEGSCSSLTSNEGESDVEQSDPLGLEAVRKRSLNSREAPNTRADREPS